VGKCCRTGSAEPRYPVGRAEFGVFVCVEGESGYKLANDRPPRTLRTIPGVRYVRRGAAAPELACVRWGLSLIWLGNSPAPFVRYRRGPRLLTSVWARLLGV
jgi:hypothetical protein